MAEKNDIGRIIKQRRVMVPLTLQELAAKSGVSASHLGRIERGERFPSAWVLQKIAKPLGFEEDELLSLAGYLTKRSAGGQLGLKDVMELAQAFTEFQNATSEFLQATNKFGSILEKIAKKFSQEGEKG